MKEMRISTWDPAGTKAKPRDASVKYDDDRPPVPVKAIEAAPDDPTQDKFILVFDVPDHVEYTHGAYLTTTLQDRTDGQRILVGEHIDVNMLPPDPEEPDLPDLVLPRLVADKLVLRKATGERFTAIDATDFCMAGRELHGEDTTLVLRQRAACGYNMLREFTAYDIPTSIGVLKPKDHPGFYDLLRASYRRAMGFGFYINAVAFTGTKGTGYSTLFKNDTEKIDHWEQMIAVAQECPNVILSRVNEYTVTANHDIPLAALRRPPAPILASAGSNGSEAFPVVPFWDWTELHTNNAFEWQRKVGHNAWEIWKGPTIASENRRYPDNTQRLDHAFGAAAGAALLCAGSTFHSVRGKTSHLWREPVELPAAMTWAAGARSIPLSCQNLAYKHRKDLETSKWLRVYQRGHQPEHLAFIPK